MFSTTEIINLKLPAKHPKYKNIKHWKFNNCITKNNESGYDMIYRCYVSNKHPYSTEWKDKVFDGSGFATLDKNFKVLSDTILTETNEYVDARIFYNTKGQLQTTFNRYDGSSKKEQKLSLNLANISNKLKFNRQHQLLPELQNEIQKNWSHIVFDKKDQFLYTLSPTVILSEKPKKIQTTDSRNVFKDLQNYYGKSKNEIFNSQPDSTQDIIPNVFFRLSSQTITKNGYIGVGHAAVYSDDIKKDTILGKFIEKHGSNKHYKNLIYFMYFYKLDKSGNVMEISEAFIPDTNNEIDIVFGMGITENKNGLFNVSYGIDDRRCAILKNFDINSLVFYGSNEIKGDIYLFSNKVFK